MDQNERFRQKIRDRNLGRVQSQTYPANQSAGSAADRFAAKMARHAVEAKPQDEAPVEAKADPADAPSGRRSKG